MAIADISSIHRTRGRSAGETAARRAATARSTRVPYRGARWGLFALQALVVVMIEVGNDIVRGNIVPPNAGEALRNARQVVAFEHEHGFFAEPALQLFFLHPHRLLGMVLTWDDIVRLCNGVYAFCHIFVTLAIAVWIFAAHRDRFSLVRNVMMGTNLLALLVYELYPMAPPRLTTGVWYAHHPFQFHDTMKHILGTGTLNGTPIGYNPLSAMPSLHVAWALVMGTALVILARNPIVRVAGALYPLLMTFTVVVTANHYIMDAVGAAVVAGCGTVVALSLESLRAMVRLVMRRARQSKGATATLPGQTLAR